MSNLVSFTTQDSSFRYRITAQATSLTTASTSIMKTNLDTQATTTETYEITDIEVINDVLKGKVSAHGVSESFTLTPGPNDTETIQTGGFFLGIGAQTLGPFILNPTDEAAVEAWKQTNFVHD